MTERRSVTCVNNLLMSRLIIPFSICRAPDYGSQGEVRLPFAENGSSKVGVRFDKQIPGGIDLGGNCELDHGLFCSGMFRMLSCISISLNHYD